MEVNITIDLIKYVMGHWLMYMLFFILGMIFMHILISCYYWIPAVIQSIRNARFFAKYLKFRKNNKKDV